MGSFGSAKMSSPVPQQTQPGTLGNGMQSPT